MKYILPDYNNCICNLISSIRKFYGLKIYHPTLSQADKLLDKKKYDKVILILCDGLGSKIISKHLDKNTFLVKHKVCDFLSTFPSTTSAATVSARTGKTPFETAWLAWHVYYKQIDNDLICFTGKEYFGDKVIEPNPSEIYMPYDSLVEELNKVKIPSNQVFPGFQKQYIHAKTFHGFINKILKLNKENRYIYGYWDEPDHTMHSKGTMHNKTHRLIKNINKNLDRLSRKIDERTLCFVIADHGHIDVKTKYFDEHPDLCDCFVRKPTFESRNIAFFIKKGCNKKFETLFKKYYGKYFLLFNRKQVLNKGFFGNGKEHKMFSQLIGDYQACSISNVSIEYSKKYNNHPLASAHAGITENEMLIPLISISK